MARNLGESREPLRFSMIRGSGGSKSRLAKAAGAEPCGQRGNEKSHAPEGPSTCLSQNVRNTSVSEHFLKARQNAQNTSSLGAFLEV